MTAFPITEHQPVRFSGPGPSSCDVVVIGGGIIGLMAAWFLAGRGLKVTLCEKGRVAGEQSSRNWGWIRQQGRDPAELPIMVEALGIWHQLARECGPALGFRQSGVIYLANAPRDLARFRAWLPHASANGIDSRMLDRTEVARLYPGSAANWQGALHTPSDACIEPAAAMALLAGEAALRGVRIVENCAVRALERVGGRIGGVMTEAGRIACNEVVLAGGAWSALFARSEGVHLPQLSVRASAAISRPLQGPGPIASGDNRFAFRRRPDGSYLLAERHAHDFFVGPDAFRHLRAYLPALRNDWKHNSFRAVSPKNYPDAWFTPRHWSPDATSPFEAMRVLNPRPNVASLNRMRRAFAQAFPALGLPDLHTTWAGMIDTLPDALPVIDRVAAIPGLTIATGFSGHGFGIGPGVGRVLADLVMGNRVGHDLQAFRLSRFGA
jgi:glycine/D-amino acid oxidase-like deaminating enzyme